MHKKIVVKPDLTQFQREETSRGEEEKKPGGRREEGSGRLGDLQRKTGEERHNKDSQGRGRNKHGHPSGGIHRCPPKQLKNTNVNKNQKKKRDQKIGKKILPVYTRMQMQ